MAKLALTTPRSRQASTGRPSRSAETKPAAKGIADAGGIYDLRRAAEPPMKAVFPGVVQNAASRSLLEHDEPEAAGCQPGKHPLRVELGLLEEQLADSPAGRGPFR
jgi:hypothetical protein